MTSKAELVERDEQAREVVRTDLGSTLFVEAGAGTGKTTALVDRIFNLVTSSDENVQRSLSEIAAITFTEAAAAELRERVRLKFEDALREAREANDPRLVEICERALGDADIAAIQTLHGFAQRLLSEFPVEVGIPPRVEVIDEVQSQLAFDQRWSTFLDALYADTELEDFIVRAACLGVGLNGKELRNIAHVFGDNWDRLLGVAQPTSVVRPIDFGRVNEAMVQIEQLADHCLTNDDKLLIKIRTMSETFARFRKASSDTERLRLVRPFADLKFGRAGAKTNWSIPVTDARETCGQLAEASAELVGAVADDTLRQFAGKIAQFTVEAATERREEGVLEFHDLLVLAQQLLRTSPVARAGLAARYRVLMLDEFQDTDPIQITLAMLLASAISEDPTSAWSDVAAEPGRLFMVGDPKQSIYRFRRADISVFLEARAKFTAGGVSLQQNFRTVEPIIAAVNGLFTEVMPEDTEGQAKYSPLIASREPSPALDHRPLILGGGHEAKAAELRGFEANDVASVVADIARNPHNWLVEDDGRWRPAKLSDVTILLPTRTSMTQLSSALDERNIAFRADTGTLVYETQEVKDLLSVLRAIDDPSDEIAVVAALRSPLYGCGYDDLLAFTESHGRFVLDRVIPEGLTGTVVAAGIEHMASLERRKWWDEPSELLIRLIDERHAMALPARGRRARDTWRRLRYVVDQARAFAESGGGDLRSYLAWTDLQGRDGSRAHEPMLAEPDDEAVQIMTIHGSKGLEFPITIVSGLTTRSGRRAQTGEVVWGEPGTLPEVKAKKSVSTARFDDQKDLDAEMDGPERDRLLYVALTRARDHLVVSGYHPVNKSGKPTDCHGAKVHAWAHGAGEELIRTWTPPLGDDMVNMTLDDVIDLAARTSEIPKVATPGQWSDLHGQRLRAGRVQSTTSATALAQRSAVRAGDTETAVRAGAEQREEAVEDESSDLPPRVFRRGRAGTAIGSAVHAVLQHMDLADPDEAQLLALTEAQAWAESVPEHVETIRSAVYSALASPIVQRCRVDQHYKELYVAAPVGSTTVEGYIDLLVDTPDGLVVVDYKTDSVQSEAEVDAKLDHYGLQGTAYALAIEASTGRQVVDVQFIFTRAEGAITRSVRDFDRQRQSLLDTVASPIA